MNPFDLSRLDSVQSPAYRALWNDSVQSEIDQRIERYRKSDAVLSLGIPEGTPVEIELKKHAFYFGAHLFNYDQLGAKELNEKYKALYGTLFNSATIAFYWGPFEPEEGKARFQASPEDSEEFWNQVEQPSLQGHWRRPPSDPVVEFCERKGIRRHGHPIMWGNHTWHYPRWLMAKLPKEILVECLSDTRCGTNIMMKSAEEIERLLPEFVQELNQQMVRRVTMLAEHYGNRIQSWDVVNESAWDFACGWMVPGSKLCKSTYGFMPGDYTYQTFQLAQKLFPPEVALNINDYNLSSGYGDQIDDLRKRGCKIDTIGAQMHLFNPKQCLEIIQGKSMICSPDDMLGKLNSISGSGLPVHLSEITIACPETSEHGQLIQAAITRNLYRLWFSYPSMNGITWWNVVDDCGAPGEPSVSGLFSRKMEPKIAYHVLNDLIHREWTTRLTVKTGKAGTISFRGFRGEYELRYRDATGNQHIEPFNLG